MRDQLFQYYVEFGHELCYLRAYLISSRRIGNVYSGFLLLASAAGIVTLSYWDYFPMLWAFITISAQALQALKPLTQSSKQRQALKYIIQDANLLFYELTQYWDTVGAFDHPPQTDEMIGNKISEFKRKYREITDRFASDIDFPRKKRLEEKAKQENARYFWYHYKMRIEEEF